MKVFVISGGPGVGKTSVINELKKRGHEVLREAAREVSNTDQRFVGKSILEVNKKDFQDAIFDFQKIQLSELLDSNNVFTDRGLGDTLAYYGLAGYNIPHGKFEYVKNFRYDKVFILDFFDFYEKDELRQESMEEQRKVHNEVTEMYENLSYDVIKVPFMGVEERADFIINLVDE